MSPARSIVFAPRLAFLSLLLAAVAVANPPLERTAGHPAASSPASAVETVRHPPAARPINLVNAGFESETTDPNGDPEGWYTGQHAGETSYLFTVDSAAKHGGAQSLRIDNVGRQPFGSIVQVVAAPELGGKRVRFSAWLKTRAADADGASLFIIAETGGNVMAEGSAVRGTHDWARHSVTLAIPAQADRLRVGATLRGTGTLWLDDAELEIVSAR